MPNKVVKPYHKLALPSSRGDRTAVLVIGHSVARMVLRMGRQSGGRLRRFGQKRVGLSKNSVRWRLGILGGTSI